MHLIITMALAITAPLVVRQSIIIHIPPGPRRMVLHLVR